MISIFENYVILKILSLSGLFGGIFYFLHIIMGRIFYPGYNALAQAISDLTASKSPSKKIAFIFSFLYGVCTVIFSIVFYIYFSGEINTFFTFGSFAFCCMNIISFFGYTFFPLSESGKSGTFQDIIHLFITIFVVIFTTISLLLFGIGFFRSETYKFLGIISACILILLVTGAILVNKLPKEYFGVAERISIYSTIIYTCILSIWMYKYIG